MRRLDFKVVREERVTTESIAPQAEALLVAIVNSSDDAIYSKDPDAVLTTWNPGAQRLYGYSPEEVVGKPLSILVPQHRKGEEIEILRRVLKGERVERFDTERLHKDGSVIEVSVTVSPIKDASGQIVGASTIAQDIRERRERSTLRARLSAIVESSDDAIYSKSTEGVLTSWNMGAERLYGYSPEEAIGQSVSMIIPPHRSNEERQILTQILGGKKVEHYDTERLRKDGEIVNVSITVSPMRDSEDRIIGASTIARDVSARKQIEDMKDRFIANAAHELRTPLTTLSALTFALATRWDDIEGEKRQDLLEAMVRQAERSKILINNLLELSQVGAGQIRLQMEAVDVSKLVSLSVEGAPPPDGKSVELKVEKDLKAHADSARLGQVVTNLLTNSYRYGGDAIEVEARGFGDVILLAISDDGLGVPDNLIDEIFDPFTRGPEAGSKQGSGLGLAISRALVEAFDGSISYHHNRPHGAVFDVRLRRAE